MLVTVSGMFVIKMVLILMMLQRLLCQSALGAHLLRVDLRRFRHALRIPNSGSTIAL